MLVSCQCQYHTNREGLTPGQVYTDPVLASALNFVHQHSDLDTYHEY